MEAPRDDRPTLERWLQRVFDDDEPTRLGSGWLSGTLRFFLGALGLSAVLVFFFPEWLSTARFRALYPLPLLRALVQGGIATGFIAGCISLLLLDRLFGTAYLPRGRWPGHYGIAGDPVPEGYLDQLAFPLRKGSGPGL